MIQKNTILENGLNINQDIARKARETMIKNGNLKYYGYSKISKKVFEKIINDFNLPLSNCLYAEKEYVIITENLEKNQVFRIDFTYMKDEKPFFFIEFNGNKFHIRESELELKRNETNLFGEKLSVVFEKDLKKKQYLQNHFPDSYFFEIWEDTIEEDCKKIYQFLQSLKLI